MMNEDYLDFTADVFCGMRLIVEGAIVLYEGDALPLDTLAKDASLHEARAAFNTLGKALYDLRQHVKELEAASHHEGERRMAEACSKNSCYP